MGFDILTAMELCGNPRDLCFSIVGGPADKFSFVISRGSGHNFKVMLSTTPFARTRNEAVETIEDILKISREVIEREIPATSETEANDRLDEKMIEWIVDELRKKNAASTCEAPIRL